MPLQDQRGEQLQGFGRAMVGAGAQAMDVGQAQHEDYVAAVAREHDSLFGDAVRKADAQFMGLKGKAALDAREAADKALEEQQTSIAAAIPDEVARDVFEQKAKVRRQQLMTRWDRHQGDQRTAYEVGQLDASSKGAVEDYRRFFGDKQAEADARQRALSNVDQLAEKMGAPPAVRDRMRLEVTTALHSGVLEDLFAQKRTGEAAAYLEQHQGEIDGAVRAQAAAKVAVGADRDRAYTLLTSPEMQALALPDKLVALAGKRAAGEITTAQLDIAQRRALDDAQLARQARSEHEGELLTAAVNWVSANQGQDLSGLGEERIVQLKQAGLWDDVETFAAEGGTNRPAGLAMFAGFVDDPTQLQGKTWAEVQRSVLPVLDARHVEIVRGMWAVANDRRKGGGAAATPEMELVSDARFKVSLARDAGVLPATVRDEKDVGSNATAYDDFLERLEQDANLEAKAKGRKLTRDELRAIVRGYKAMSVESGGRPALLPLLPPEQGAVATVVEDGQRVEIGDVLSDPDAPDGAQIRPEIVELVHQWNRVQNTLPDGEVLDPGNPVHAARVLGATRAEDARRRVAREPARAARIAQLRWQDAQNRAREDALLRDMLNRGVVPGSVTWKRELELLYDPDKAKLDREMRQRRAAEAANPWRMPPSQSPQPAGK